MKIRKVTREDFNGIVYNLEIKDTHTYFADGVLVHNCHEKATPDGKHGDILNIPFLNSLEPYTELAIGG